MVMLKTDNFLPHGSTASNKLGPPHYRRFTITHNDTSQSIRLLCTSDRLDAGTSTSRSTTLTRNKTSMPPAEFEPTILASERSHTHALDRASTGIKTEESSVQSLENNFISSITVILVDISLKHWGRSGTFKLFKRPFPGFLTILTL